VVVGRLFEVFPFLDAAEIGFLLFAGIAIEPLSNFDIFYLTILERIVNHT
jgi:hypothetical protein